MEAMTVGAEVLTQGALFAHHHPKDLKFFQKKN